MPIRACHLLEGLEDLGEGLRIAETARLGGDGQAVEETALEAAVRQAGSDLAQQEDGGDMECAADGRGRVASGEYQHGRSRPENNLPSDLGEPVSHPRRGRTAILNLGGENHVVTALQRSDRLLHDGCVPGSFRSPAAYRQNQSTRPLD